MFVINNLLATKVLVNYDLKKVLFGPFSFKKKVVFLSRKS